MFEPFPLSCGASAPLGELTAPASGYQEKKISSVSASFVIHKPQWPCTCLSHLTAAAKTSLSTSDLQQVGTETDILTKVHQKGLDNGTRLLSGAKGKSVIEVSQALVRSLPLYSFLSCRYSISRYLKSLV